MKLKQWALIAEIVGGVAIVLSLVFVGYEVRQSNETRVQTATQTIVSEHIGTIRLLAQENELACIYAVGVQDYEGMSARQRVRFSAWILSYLYNVEQMYLILLQGEIDENIWAGFDTTVREIMSLRGTRQWYAVRRGWFSGPFQAYLDEYEQRPLLSDPVVFTDSNCSWVRE